MTTATSTAGLTIPTLADVNAYMVEQGGEPASVCESNTNGARVTVVFADVLGEVTRSLNPAAVDSDGFMDYSTEIAVANEFVRRENAHFTSRNLTLAIEEALVTGKPVLLHYSDED